MKNQDVVNLRMSFAVLLCCFLAFSSCSKDEEGESTIVSGKLILPESAEGDTWIVAIDDDLNGENGKICECIGNCPSGKEFRLSLKKSG